MKEEAISPKATTSLKSKLFRTFSRSSPTTDSRRKQLMSIATLNGAETLAQQSTNATQVSNPMFDYDLVDDIHAEELTTISSTMSNADTPRLTIDFDSLKQQQNFPSTNCAVSSKADIVDGNDQKKTCLNLSKDENEKNDNNNNEDKFAEITFDSTNDVHQGESNCDLEDVNSNAGHHHHCHDSRLDKQLQAQTKQAMSKLIAGFVMCLIFMIIELVGGYLSSSLAIFTGKFNRFNS